MSSVDESFQYVRDHLNLRTRPATNNVADYGDKKAVENLPQDVLLDVEVVSVQQRGGAEERHVALVEAVAPVYPPIAGRG